MNIEEFIDQYGTMEMFKLTKKEDVKDGFKNEQTSLKKKEDKKKMKSNTKKVQNRDNEASPGAMLKVNNRESLYKKRVGKKSNEPTPQISPQKEKQTTSPTKNNKLN